jgi:hypothetical protein
MNWFCAECGIPATVVSILVEHLEVVETSRLPFAAVREPIKD